MLILDMFMAMTPLGKVSAVIGVLAILAWAAFLVQTVRGGV